MWTQNDLASTFNFFRRTDRVLNSQGQKRKLTGLGKQRTNSETDSLVAKLNLVSFAECLSSEEGMSPVAVIGLKEQCKQLLNLPQFNCIIDYYELKNVIESIEKRLLTEQSKSFKKLLTETLEHCKIVIRNGRSAL